ncbi:peptidase A22B, signal peptide peptidase [Neolentinus lepideus HHB14362 ss-1]|uniref:Peptidase A22B, signal peptide peptidase n=1 Tax=Neolentinus lepideus HHB14362 ss-1 TaxID=1314782 RepID=A0A165V5U2_9AGAM|nr:peptidase A22B, signal peptide peptidase [Neolentinus lepideus HHB14362 ss-1]
MVKVATTLDVPIKLLWPKSARGHTMLGLGDVVVPGVFVALALRYDAHRAATAAAKPYFRATLLAYVLGLGAAMGAMHAWGKAQPALLYLRCVLVGCVWCGRG